MKKTKSCQDNECPICIAEYISEDELVTLNCKHLFHVKCIDDWLKKQPRCPCCREEHLLPHEGDITISADLDFSYGYCD